MFKDLSFTTKAKPKKEKKKKDISTMLKENDTSVTGFWKALCLSYLSEALSTQKGIYLVRPWGKDTVTDDGTP